MAPSLLSLVLLVPSSGCEGVLPGVNWQQMNHQDKFRPYSECDFFADHRTLRPLPHGTVTHRPAAVDTAPPALTRELLVSGRVAFERYCATCHGITGDGRSTVAENMELRRPPSLIDGPVRALAPERLFEVITLGYGLMPAYARQLPVGERWAVVGYLRALQRSRSVRLDELPTEVRAAAVRALAAPTGATP